MACVIILALLIILYICCHIQSKTTEYLNDKNDGIYSVTIKRWNKKYQITFDTNNKTILLIANKKEKLYFFDEIDSWEYNIEYTKNRFGGKFLDTKNSYFIIKTTDLEIPIWRMPLLPNGFIGLGYYTKTEDFYQKWLQLTSNLLNRSR